MTVGILGGGQLGRMMALAGYPLGLRFRFLDPSPMAPAGQLARRMAGHYTDEAFLRRFADGLDVVTYEFENVPVSAAQFLAERVPVYPPPEALAVSQDRLNEKRLFQQLGIPVPTFAPVDSQEDLDRAVECIGLPLVLKTRRLGYDGKGQKVIRSAPHAARAWEELGAVPLIAEEMVSFEREVSIIAVRGRKGWTAFYPLVENHHARGILRRSISPAPDLNPKLEAEAQLYADRVLRSLGYVGVLAIEFFQIGGRLLANEMAPRVHNSGHWTIEGAETSQFENHLRAVVGYPLGPVTPRGCSLMLNIIGAIPRAAAVLAVPGAHLHLYDKRPRPGRKLGHITLCCASRDVLEERAERLAALVR